MTILTVQRGDITRLQVDAIVNAANDHLAPGAGVCGAIHKAAGPELAEACYRLHGCPTGSAKITPGFRLPAPWVIHAVGPIWNGGGQGEAELLASCYTRSLELAAEKGLHSIAFPFISSGIYGYPKEQAARVAISAVQKFVNSPSSLQEVIFCCFSTEDETLYRLLLTNN